MSPASVGSAKIQNFLFFFYWPELIIYFRLTVHRFSLGKVFIVYVHFREEDGIVWVIHPPWHMCKSHPNFVVVVWMHISIVA